MNQSIKSMHTEWKTFIFILYLNGVAFPIRSCVSLHEFWLQEDKGVGEV
jgi:hypothetical protein